MSVQQQIDRINTEVSAQETLLDQALAAIADKAAGSGSGGGLETCQLTIKQQWGGNNDPEILRLYIMTYNIVDGEPVPYYAEFTSASDFEAEHSVTLTVYKNASISFLTKSSFVKPMEGVTVTTTNGALDYSTDLNNMDALWLLTPTGDDSTFTFYSD